MWAPEGALSRRLLSPLGASYCRMWNVVRLAPAPVRCQTAHRKLGGPGHSSSRSGRPKKPYRVLFSVSTLTFGTECSGVRICLMNARPAGPAHLDKPHRLAESPATFLRTTVQKAEEVRDAKVPHPSVVQLSRGAGLVERRRVSAPSGSGGRRQGRWRPAGGMSTRPSTRSPTRSMRSRPTGSRS